MRRKGGCSCFSRSLILPTSGARIAGTDPGPTTRCTTSSPAAAPSPLRPSSLLLPRSSGGRGLDRSRHNTVCRVHLTRDPLTGQGVSGDGRLALVREPVRGEGDIQEHREDLDCGQGHHAQQDDSNDHDGAAPAGSVTAHRRPGPELLAAGRTAGRSSSPYCPGATSRKGESEVRAVGARSFVNLRARHVTTGESWQPAHSHPFRTCQLRVDKITSIGGLGHRCDGARVVRLPHALPAIVVERTCGQASCCSR